MSPLGPQYGFGLYVHWPYCSRVCPYCDFNVYAAKARETAPLVAAICADIQAHRALLPEHPALSSIFLGGGTPSLLSASDMAAILKAADEAFGLAPGAEITLEANPNDLSHARLADWAACGVNRLSIGVQSLNDDALVFLGREHDSATARRAIEAGAQQFDNHSIDLIYALPGQSLDQWRTELSNVLAMGAPHLSLYELTIAERTAFWHRTQRGELTPLDDDAQADLYEVTQDLCDAAGLPAYEISNHAAAPAYASVHNNIYWSGGDWIGVGPGAHGRLTINGVRYASEAARRPQAYIEAPTAPRVALSQLESAREYLAMGLRPVHGLSLPRLQALSGTLLDAGRLAGLVEAGLVRTDGECLALTKAGRLLADYVAGQLTP